MKIKIKKLRDDAFLPMKETELSGGFDLVAPETVLVPKGRSVIKLGFAVELPAEYGMFIFARSGVALKGVPGDSALRGETRYDCDVQLGLIDADYRGEVGILVNNHDEDFMLVRGTSIAQAVFLPVPAPVFVLQDDLSETKRGEQGFKG